MDYGLEISQRATRLTIAVPFEGDRILFTCEASGSSSIYPRARVDDTELLLTHDFIQVRTEDPRATFDRELDLIDRFLAWTRTDVERFIPSFRQTIQAAIRERRDHLTSAAAAVAALGVPVKPRGPASSSGAAAAPAREFDAFVSYASEDRDFAAPLAEALTAAGFRVWFAERELTVGDSLNQSINRALQRARYGIVVLSTHFLAKPWPQYELGGLLAREMEGQKVVLPVWRNISKEYLLAHQPALVDKYALSSPSMSLAGIVAGLSQVLRQP